MNLLQPAGARTDHGRAREITHHALDHTIPLRILWWPRTHARMPVHSRSV